MPRWTEQQLKDYEQRRSAAKDHREGTRPVVEQAVGHDPLAAAQVEGGYTGRFLVRVVSYRTHLLDQDNLAEKYHVDACRYAGLIPSDAPGQTEIEVIQQKVKTKAEARTEITIERIT